MAMILSGRGWLLHCNRIGDEKLKKRFSNFTYQELCQIRGVCKSLKKMVEKRLNKAYFKLRKDIDCIMMEKFFEVMPKQESKHRNHPLNDLQSLATIMKRRLDSLGYKFDDPIKEGHCCFYAGKMLDVMVPMLDWIDSYLPSLEEIAQNTRSCIESLLSTPPDQFNAYDMAVPFTDLDYLLEHQFLKYTKTDIKRHKERSLSTWKTHKGTYRPQSVADSSSYPSRSPPSRSRTYTSQASSTSSTASLEEDISCWPNTKPSNKVLLALANKIKLLKTSSDRALIEENVNQSFVILNLEEKACSVEDKQQVVYLLQTIGLSTSITSNAQIDRIDWWMVKRLKAKSHLRPRLLQVD
uniref:F-box domain-containing protein n=1 Tax=Ditylenchus dipsaci TaxID=166011 RepID=A0A915D246_9BILA